MLGSKYPESIDSYTAGDNPFLAAVVFNQVAALCENTQRSMGQDLGDLSESYNFTDDTFAKQFKKLLRVEFGTETYNIGSGTSKSTSNQGTRELAVTFPNYSLSGTVFSDASKMSVFVMEAGGNVNSQTTPSIGSRLRDSGNIVEGSVTTTGFSWRHDETNYIGSIMWLAVEWGE